MITKLLIANRGEIACRIARTAHRMGIATVGLYSEPDANALHVDSVDAAIALWGSTPAESYLRGEAVIQAALTSGCDAVHPGYGFLAENADFAQAVIAAGLCWVGPAPEQIRLLGDKVAAKEAAVAAGVPTTGVTAVAPGSIPAAAPMPALVKAAAGGGGRGMRVVRTRDELGDAVAAASREAQSAFGDGSVFIEPYIEHGRHIEVQILGDNHGNVIHLGERECSIQRRNQKIVEEAPSAGIDEPTRQTLCDAALALARHVDYQNAGTVEFLAGADGSITFLEVNTRLQVEHPVTEAVTGLDLVELQLRVAAGEALPVAQSEVLVTGHAIEVRVVAEDPSAGWLPSTGVVSSFAIGAGVRVDTGFRAGAAVSSDYDSLLAKVISHGPTRHEAALRLRRALHGSQITGVATNVPALIAILGEADFLAAATATTYLDDHPQILAARGPAQADQLALLVAAAMAVEHRDRTSTQVLDFAPSGWRNLRTHGERTTWLLGDEAHHVEYVRHGDAADVWIGPWPVPLEDGGLAPDERVSHHVRLLARSPTRQVVEIDGRRTAVDVVLEGERVHTSSPAGSLSWSIPPRFDDHELEAAGGGPISPLPGTVIAVHVEAGQEVEAGQLLMVVEAMKMEHKIEAAGPSRVAEVRFAEGERVDTGDLLVSLEPLEEGE